MLNFKGAFELEPWQRESDFTRKNDLLFWEKRGNRMEFDHGS